MKYDYSVKFNGRWYKPGEEVPEITEPVAVDIVTAPENDEPEKKPSKKKN